MTYNEDHEGELSVYDPAQSRGGNDIAVAANGQLFPLDKDWEDPEYAYDNTVGLMNAMSEAEAVEVQFSTKTGRSSVYRFSLDLFNRAAGHARYHCSPGV